MFAGKRSADRSGLMRQAARLIVEEALEAEARQELGRGYYAHGAGERRYRNGYRMGKVKTAEGMIEFAVPQVSDTAEPFRSQRQVLRGRTEELERLAVEMYARGLSVRDIEAAFTDESGRYVLTKTTASELTERLWQIIRRLPDVISPNSRCSLWLLLKPLAFRRRKGRRSGRMSTSQGCLRHMTMRIVLMFSRLQADTFMNPPA